jgi:hypothetical protein
VAEHPAAFFEFHVNETLLPSLTLEALEDKVTAGVAATADVDCTGTYVTDTCCVWLQLMP